MFILCHSKYTALSVHPTGAYPTITSESSGEKSNTGYLCRVFSATPLSKLSCGLEGRAHVCGFCILDLQWQIQLALFVILLLLDWEEQGTESPRNRKDHIRASEDVPRAACNPCIAISAESLSTSVSEILMVSKSHSLVSKRPRLIYLYY